MELKAAEKRFLPANLHNLQQHPDMCRTQLIVLGIILSLQVPVVKVTRKLRNRQSTMVVE
jgi:hypothetical protein